MKVNYSLPRLSLKEQELIRAILLDEMDIQQWFAVTFSVTLGRELVVVLQ